MARTRNFRLTLRRGSYRSIVHVPPLEISRLRESLSRRRHFVRLATAEINAVKRLLRSEGLSALAGSLTTAVGWDKLEQSLKPHDPTLCFYIRQHHALWQLARAQIKQLEQLLEQQQLPFSHQLARLKTVPSVGPIVALTAVAVFSDVCRFATAKQAASYAGLVPSTDQSGARDRHGKITKQGSAELRAMRCEAAHHAAHRNHPLNLYFRNLPPGMATKWRWWQSPIGSVAFSTPFSSTKPTSMSASSPSSAGLSNARASTSVPQARPLTTTTNT